MDVLEKKFGDVPVLLIAESLQRPLPAVLWYHGLTASKEANRKELEQIAREGFLAVAVDAVGHGARRDTRERPFRDLVHESVAEVPSLIDALVAGGHADEKRIGIAGVSFGGFILYRALNIEPRLRAAVALVGSPPKEMRPPSAALLSITAERDERVPPNHAREFHQSLPADERFRYIELPGAQHIMTGEQWNAAMSAMLDWLSRWPR
ncbi:MAG: alpha/beta hydrolase family protein [Thermoanaerobaculia bacterium]